MRPAVQLAAPTQLPAIYIWTHDSIGLADEGSPSVLIGPGPKCRSPWTRRTSSRRWHPRPCFLDAVPEWFAAQDLAYRDTVLPPAMRARVSVEAGITSGWKGPSVTPAAASASSVTARQPITSPCAASSVSPPMPSPPPHEESIHDAKHGTWPSGHPATFA
jgi:hypothetical protein